MTHEEILKDTEQLIANASALIAKLDDSISKMDRFLEELHAVDALTEDEEVSFGELIAGDTIQLSPDSEEFLYTVREIPARSTAASVSGMVCIHGKIFHDSEYYHQGHDSISTADRKGTWINLRDFIDWVRV